MVGYPMPSPPDEAEALIEPKRADVGHLRLEDGLITAAVAHTAHRELH